MRSAEAVACTESPWHGAGPPPVIYAFLLFTRSNARPFSRLMTNNRKKRHAENHDGMAWKGHEVSKVSAALTGSNARIYLPTFLLDCYLSDYKDVTRVI
jgi:hypothetical protein